MTGEHSEKIDEALERGDLNAAEAHLTAARERLAKTEGFEAMAAEYENRIRIARAARAFADGNNRLARNLVQAVLARPASDTATAEARDLLARLQPDRAAVITGALCLLLFVYVVWAYILSQ